MTAAQMSPHYRHRAARPHYWTAVSDSVTGSSVCRITVSSLAGGDQGHTEPGAVAGQNKLPAHVPQSEKVSSAAWQKHSLPGPGLSSTELS